jgi:hypothetical protein
MAFQLPQQQAAPQQHSITSQLNTTEPQPERYVEDAEEWVLFSPSQRSNTAHTYTNSTERTPRTAGLSHLSDFGSLDTIARSHEDHLSQALEDDEGTELDSLDNHLHAFRESASPRRPSRLDQSGGTVLPAHDGLGMFAPSSSPVREHLYQFERFNSRRRRRISDEDEGMVEEAREEERMRRIQEWRMEHSRVVLDEIEKATRRRRMSSLTEEIVRDSRYDEDTATMSGTGNELVESTNRLNDGSVTGNIPAEEGTESVWQRLTRRFIRDFMGIDDSMLSVLFGESLPKSLMDIPEAAPTTADSRYDQEHSIMRTSRSWEDRLFERLARELGTLMHQLSEHPGAFSTYLNTLEPLDYAGISSSSTNPSFTAPQTASRDNSHQSSQHILNSSSPNFAPTLPFVADNTALFTAETNTDSNTPQMPESDHQQQDREYWERELDVKMVFGFLRNRFSSSRRPPTSHNLHTTPANLATTLTASAAARAALIRAHHPLVSRRPDTQRCRSSLSHRSNLTRSARRNSCRSQSYRSGSMSGSSRNFWDLGSSVAGTKSGSALGIGAWGEV